MKTHTISSTRSKKSYKMVIRNIIEFLKIRKEKNQKVKIGLNYIILKENINDIKKLCTLINYINKEIWIRNRFFNFT